MTRIYIAFISFPGMLNCRAVGLINVSGRMVVTDEPSIVDYETKRPASRRWGLSRSVWLLIAGFSAFVEFAGWLGTNGRINGWGDIAFVVITAALGLVALMNAIRPVRTD